MTSEKLSERMLDYCREDDPLRLEIKALEAEVEANKQIFHNVEIILAEKDAENQKFKERLEDDKIPNCIGKYGFYMDCECICFYGEICKRCSDAESRLSQAQELVEKHPKLHAEFNMGGECERTYYDEDELDKFFKEWLF